MTVQEVNKFQDFFHGNEFAYGVHIPDKSRKNGKKVGKSFTKQEFVRYETYFSHVDGKQSIGIIPVNKDNCIKFAVIDVDVYNNQQKLISIVDKIYKHDLPFLPFLTKSGGLHLFLFLKSFTDSKQVLKSVREYLPIFGLDDKVEIFPKQTSISEGGTGNWINLPYFAEKYRPMIDKEFKPVSFSRAILEIERKRMTIEQLEVTTEGLLLANAPPCLQTIYYDGYTDMRNEYLFNMAVYLKAVDEESFEFEVQNANNQLRNPVDAKELEDTLLSSHRKRTYSYKCKLPPICDFCNKAICQTRQFGVGGGEISELSFEEFFQHKADPPYYEWVVNGTKLTFYSETEIIQQQKFRELCMREIHILPVRLKDITWTKIVNRALGNIQIVEEDPNSEISLGSIFLSHLYEFLELRVKAQTKPQILLGRVFVNKERHCYMFQSKDFIDFMLNEKKFFSFRVAEMQTRLRRLGGKSIKTYIDKRNKSMRVWELPLYAMDDIRVNSDIDFKLDFDKLMEAKINDEESY